MNESSKVNFTSIVPPHLRVKEKNLKVNVGLIAQN